MKLFQTYFFIFFTRSVSSLDQIYDFPTMTYLEQAQPNYPVRGEISNNYKIGVLNITRPRKMAKREILLNVTRFRRRR